MRSENGNGMALEGSNAGAGSWYIVNDSASGKTEQAEPPSKEARTKIARIERRVRFMVRIPPGCRDPI
jgi:hypothetical protein